MPKDDFGLNPKQATFCEEYMIDLNATQAAVRAGYSPRTASEQGFDLLRNPKCQDYIQELRNVRSELTGITAERVLQEIAAIAFARPTDTMATDPETGELRTRTLETMSDHALAAVSNIKTVTTKVGREVLSTTTEVSLHNKVKALELAAKHLGMLTDKLQMTGNVVTVPVGVVGLDEEGI